MKNSGAAAGHRFRFDEKQCPPTSTDLSKSKSQKESEDFWVQAFISVNLANKFCLIENRVINIDPDILGGTPVFYGTRVPIKNLFDYLETGDSIEDFLADFDGVEKTQVVKVLEMSQKLIQTSSKILNEDFA